MSSKKTKVFVAMSGGVDSSVTAFLLQKKDYDVTGVFMRCWSGGSPSHSLGITHSSSLEVSCEEEDAEDARRVASHLGIPFYIFDFEEEYKKRVVEYMIDGYKKGITPNPDVMCNKTIKFDLFLKESLRMGADYIATGHYVRLRRNFQTNSKLKTKYKILNTKYKLYAAKDTNKDQSYFLWSLTQDQLKHCLFPIGGYQKSKVRKIARKASLPTAEKKDSQGICFLGKFSVTNFLKQHIPVKNGDVTDTNGRKIGEHDGVWFYTIGQRHGLNLKYAKTPNSSPHYIVSKDITTNTIVVAESNTNPALYRKDLELTNVNFINPKKYKIQDTRYKIQVLCRIRYRQPLAKATLYKLPESAEPTGFRQDTRYKIIFGISQKFVAPGQSAVFYRASRNLGERGSKSAELLGGGVIL